MTSNYLIRDCIARLRTAARDLERIDPFAAAKIRALAQRIEDDLRNPRKAVQA